MSNSDESKAEVVSNELPVWEVVIGMLPDVEVGIVRASFSLVAGTFHSGRTVGQDSQQILQVLTMYKECMPELTSFPSN